MEYQKGGMPASTSVWNIISVGGVTMREAVDAWWLDTAVDVETLSPRSQKESLPKRSPGTHAERLTELSPIGDQDNDDEATAVGDAMGHSHNGSSFNAGSHFITDCVWHASGKAVFCNPVCEGFPYY